jgi:hypothetical protein
MNNQFSMIIKRQNKTFIYNNYLVVTDKMGKKLAKYLTVGAIALSSLFSKETSGKTLESFVQNDDKQTIELNGPTPWEVIGNPFSRPNVHMQIGKNKLEYYGSGDVNNDEKINSLDVEAMNNGVVNDMADVTGDGSVDFNDRNFLEKYVNGEIGYLPNIFNKL